ncbi:MAG: ClbS/DfsB family four-helix bundle protein [Shimia sp.]|uniref:ClbS/DfsB family four-helix bundle protein n=1 Tax=Shimia sp. TaxID=1954381 RepID=UPI004057CCE3
MPAATCKADLMAVAEAEFGKLMQLVAQVDAELSERSFDEDWSIKDVIAHRAHLIDMFLGWYRDGQAGKDVAFPAPGYKWNELKAYNATVIAARRRDTWGETRVSLKDAHARWLDLVTSLDEDALYGAPMKGGRNAWTTGRWAEAAAPSHYRSAAKFIRKALREAR